MRKAIQRDRVVSLKLTGSTYAKLKDLAEGMDLMTSTMAYLIVRKFLADHDEDARQPSDYDFLQYHAKRVDSDISISGKVEREKSGKVVIIV